MILLSTEDRALASQLSAQARATSHQLIHAPFSELLQLARSRDVEQIIVDLQQRLDGRLLINLLRGDQRTREIAIVAVSSDADDEKTRRFCSEHRARLEAKPLRANFLKPAGMKAVLVALREQLA